MAEPAGNSDKDSDTAVSKVVGDYVKGLSEVGRIGRGRGISGGDERERGSAGFATEGRRG